MPCVALATAATAAATAAAAAAAAYSAHRVVLVSVRPVNLHPKETESTRVLKCPSDWSTPW